MPSLDAGGRTLHYESRGSGWPLVLVHGAWLDSELWRPQLDRFADDFRVIAPELRDHGAADPADGPYRVDDLADDLRGLLDGLELGRPVVCGLSMGGLVAQQFAADHPDRVAGLALVGTVRSVPPVPLSGAGKRLLLPKAAYHAAVRSMGPGAYFRLLLNSVEGLEGRWLARSDDARSYAMDAVDAFDAGPFLRVLDALYEFEAPALPDVPATVLHGDHEAGPVVRHCRNLAERLGASRTGIPDAAHLVNRDNPAAFDRALGTFLDERVTVSA
jgi:pimeloyl-ACP methyl ester carboxylesterase